MSSRTASSLGFRALVDASTLRIATPALQSQVSAKLQLDNGLQIYLISDPAIEAAAAEMTVAAGSWQDPDKFLGTAHFLEHMLFMGTERFPDENAFDAHLSRHGGRSNAYTATNRTAYTFECKNDGFAEGLRRFAAFFEAPLLKADCLTREVQAVHQEFLGNIDNEAWRAHLVASSLSHPQHPGRRFTIGNLDTLKALDRDTLRAWYEAHYSADRMHLVVYAALPLVELQALVLAVFAGIPRRPLLARAAAGVPQMDPALGGSLLYIASRKKDQSSLSLSWDVSAALADDPQAWCGESIAYVLRHAGAGSLVASLKARGLVESLQAHAMREVSGEGVFFIDVDLTDLGVAERDTVVRLCCMAVAQLRAHGVPRHLFEEMCAQRRLNFEFQSRGDAFGTVGMHGRALVHESLETYPDRRVLPPGFDPTGMRRVLDILTPERCHLTLSAHPDLAKLDTDRVEPYMEVQFRVLPVPAACLTDWATARAETPDFALPAANPFMPSDLSLRPLDPEAPTSVAPTCLQDDDQATVRFARDHLERLPEISWSVQLRAPALAAPTPMARILATLYVRAVHDVLAEIRAAAALAGLYVQLDLGRESLELRIEGFSDRAAVLLAQVLRCLRQVQPSAAKFDEFVQSLRNAYADFESGNPWRVTQDALEAARRLHWPEHAARLTALAQVQRPDFDAFVANLWDRRYVQATLFGNLDLETAQTVQRLLTELLPGQGYPAARQRPRSIMDLPGRAADGLLTRPVTGDDSGVLVCLQVGADTPMARAAHQVLAQATGQKFFDDLRTQQQTGYKVWLVPSLAAETLFLNFYIEPHRHSTADVRVRIEAFIVALRQQLQDGSLGAEEFAQHRASLLAEWQAPPKNLGEEGRRMHRMALRGGNLRRHEENIAALQALDFAAWRSWSLNCLAPTTARLAVVVQGQRQPAG